MAAQAKNAAWRLSRALACYLLALAVGIAFIASPLLVVLAAHPAEQALAAGETSSDSSTTSESDPDDAPSSVSPESISLRAYPMLANGTDEWDIDAGSTKAISTNGGQLRILVSVVWSDGKRISENTQAWTDRGGFGQGFTYEVPDDSCVSVGPTGIVTALSNGETSIKVTPKNDDEGYQQLATSIKITCANQGKGLMVTKIQIVNEKNKAYGDNPIKFTKASKTTKCYARVTYRDKSTGDKVILSNAPGAPEGETTPPEGCEYASVEEAFATLSYQVGDDQYATVSMSKGVASVKALADATTRLYVTITGGDATKDAGFGLGVVYSSVTLSIRINRTVDNGENPSDTLTIKVVYENDTSNVITQKTYDVKQFKKLGAEYLTYTLTRSSGNYVTDRAYGVRLSKILNDVKVDSSDVSYFTLAANDGANPGKLSRKFLFMKRYYLPNYDLGGSWAEREQVPAMIALKDSWNTNTQVTGELNSGTRFRLVFGAATSADGSTDKSIKYINTLTVVLNGAAPATHGDDKDDDDEDKKEDLGTEKGKGGTGGDSGSGAGVDPSGSSTGASEGQEYTGSNISRAGAEQGSDEPDAPEWRIFEMVNKQLSDLTVQYEDNPFLPYLMPCLGLIIVIGATGEYIGFRRRLR